MRIIIFLLFTCTLSSSYAQIEDPKDKTTIQMWFDMTLGGRESAQFILGSTSDGMHSAMVPDSTKRESKLPEVLKAADCEDCPLLQSLRTDDPLDFVYKNFRLNDVYLITNFKEEYLVRLYRRGD